jgi:hypothetical protein
MLDNKPKVKQEFVEELFSVNNLPLFEKLEEFENFFCENYFDVHPSAVSFYPRNRISQKCRRDCEDDGICICKRKESRASDPSISCM